MLSNSIYVHVHEFHVTGTCTTIKWHLTLKWCPEAPVFAYLLSERYEDSLCQGSCTLKNETVLCENQGDRFAIFEVGRSKKERRKKKMEKSAV